MSHTSPAAVLVIMTADDCGQCTRFKLKELDDLLGYLRRHSEIKIVQSNVGSMSKPILSKQYHPGLQKLLGVYPSFILVPYSSWMDHQTPLRFSMLGIEVDKGGRLKLVGGVKINCDGVYGWVKEQMGNSKFSQSTSNPSRSHPIPSRPGMVYTMPVIQQFRSYQPGDDRPVDY